MQSQGFWLGLALSLALVAIMLSLVMRRKFFDLLKDKDTMMELQPLEEAARLGELMAYRHEGFWQCMDTKRDHERLEELWNSTAPWK
jgi:glucose-1-phosphate cytidylyltransferase